MAELNEREVAVNILMDIFGGGSYNNVALKKTLNGSGSLSAVQKAFVTGIVNGVLRNVIYIDYVLNKFSGVKTQKMKPVILNLLRLSVYQLLFMDKTPDHAVCDEAVKLCKKRGLVGLSGFVNGLLRNISRSKEKINLPSFLPSEKTDVINYLSVKYSHPCRLIERFVTSFGYERTVDMLRSNAEPPNVTICVNTLKISKEDLHKVLESEGVTVGGGAFMDNCLHISKTSDISKLESYKKGFYHIMDESAMLAPFLAKPKPGQKIIDLCAAPGGKSFYSAYLSGGAAAVDAFDIHAHKIKLLKDGIDRLGVFLVRASLADALRYNPALCDTADIVLLDAPCSGFGLLRKKPDIRFGKNESDITGLAALQREIVTASWRYVKPGGTLIYSTCTLTVEENEENVTWIVENFPFERRDITDDIPERLKNAVLAYSDEDSLAKGMITVMPQDFGTDGFFVACLKRV